MQPKQILAAAASLLLAACAYAQSPAQSLRNADAQWEKAFAARDLDKSVAACADDASVLPSNAPIATGHDAIRQLFSGFFAMPSLQMEWQATKAEVAKSGELGYTTGAYKMTFKDAAGKPGEDHGKYVTIWKKQKDGTWKVAYDIFNSDVPPPTS